MSINRWDPWQEIVSLREAMNNLLEESFVRPRVGMMAGAGAAAMDVKETPDAYVALIALPGARPEDVEISILGDSLRISGELKDRDSEDGAHWLLRERRLGHFERSVRLPAAVSPERATADFADGILTIHLPKAESARPKTIPIKSASTAE